MVSSAVLPAAPCRRGTSAGIGKRVVTVLRAELLFAALAVAIACIFIAMG
jgi:hypothetical protein